MSDNEREAGYNAARLDAIERTLGRIEEKLDKRSDLDALHAATLAAHSEKLAQLERRDVVAVIVAAFSALMTAGAAAAILLRP